MCQGDMTVLTMRSTETYVAHASRQLVHATHLCRLVYTRIVETRDHWIDVRAAGMLVASGIR